MTEYDRPSGLPGASTLLGVGQGPGRGQGAGDGLAVGAVIGRFVVERKVGAGGMGEVYAAYDPQLDRRVALKVLRPSGASPDAAARLVREAQALAKLAHPNVVAIHEVGEADGRVFLAMQFVEGTTVGEHLAAARPPWEEIVRLYVEAGRGLAAAHAAGLVHRDVKPSNVLIDRAGRVAVTDFGVARAAADVSSEVSAATSSSGEHRGVLSTDMTQAGAVVGTPAYMAPEQHAGQRATAASDQFGLCVSLWLGLFGQHPFVPAGHGEVTSPYEYMALICEGELAPPPAGHKVPRRIVRAIARGLARDPAARWPTMEALLTELEPRAPYRGAVIALSAVAAVGLGATAWFATRPGVAPREACTVEVADRLATAWSPAQRQAVLDGFTASGRSFAAQAGVSAAEDLERYASRWRARAIDACVDRGAPLATARRQCLDRSLVSLRAMAEMLAARPPGEVVDRASAVVGGLPSLDDCVDERALTAAGAPTSAAPEELAALESRLTEIRAELDAGLYGAADTALTALLPEVDRVAWAPLRVRARLARGELALSRLEPASAWLSEAASLATENGLTREAAQAWQALSSAAANDANADAATAYGDVAIATAKATGDRELVRRVKLRRARALARLRKLDASEALCREVLTEVRADAGAAPALLADARDCLLEAMVPAGKFDGLDAHLAESIADRTQRAGADHPAVADYTRILGHIALRRGDVEGARTHYQRAYDLRRAVFGADHLRTAESLGDLAELEADRGKRQAMLEEAVRAIAASDSPLAPLFERNLQTSLADLAAERKDTAAMRRHFDRAVELAGKMGPRSLDMAVTLLGYGQYLTRTSLDEGLAKLRESIAIFEEQRSPRVVTARAALGLVLGYHGRAAEAVPVLEAAVRDIDPATAEPYNLALMKWSLAQNLVEAGGDRGRARALAGEARAAFAALGPPTQHLVEAIDRWLHKHRH